MKVEIVANGTVSFALIPENDMDRAAMKMLLKQNNEFIEITKQTQILNKASFSEGLVIQPKSGQGKTIPAVTDANEKDDVLIVPPSVEMNGTNTGHQSGFTQINE